MTEDIITALVAHPNQIEWTSLRRRKGQVEVADHQAQRFEAGDETARAAALKAAVSRIQGPIAVALPTELALIRVVRVPTADIDEIREMASLQVDKFSPFPTEQTAIGQEILAQQENSAHVLIAACRREHVIRCGEELQAAGRLPREVDVAVLGWWRLLKQERRVPDTGLCMLLLVEARGVELIVARDGVPVVIRSLGALSADNPSQSAREIADEINYTMTALENEWGAHAPSALLVWRSRIVPNGFIDELRAACDAAVESHVLDTLPPLSEGLARRALERGLHMLDLAPQEWKAALAARRLQRRLVMIGGTFALIWLIAVASLAIGLQIQKKRLADARAELLALREPARAVEQLKEQVRSLERYLDPTYTALECLREISERLPDGVDITAFTYKKYGQIALRGEADHSDPIYDFFQALEKSELFPAVKPEGVTQQQRGGRSRSQFKITIELPVEAK